MEDKLISIAPTHLARVEELRNMPQPEGLPDQGPDPSDLMSVKSAPQILGVKPHTIQEWIDDGTLAAWSEPRTQRTFLLRRSVEEKKEADQPAQDEKPKLLKWWE